MAALILLSNGALLGWLATILTRQDVPREVLRQIGVGVAASLVIGVFTNTDGLIGSLSLGALGLSSLGAVAALFLYNIATSRNDTLV